MRWRDIPILYKLSLGFALIVLAGVIGLGHDYLQVTSIENSTKEVFQAGQYQELLLKAESAHLVWANKVANFLVQDGNTHLDVILDDTKCTFGLWLYGEGRKGLEKEVPAAAGLLRSVESHHRRLHLSVPAIQEARNSGDEGAVRRTFAQQTMQPLQEVQGTLSKVAILVDKGAAQHRDILMDSIHATQRLIIICAAFMLVGGIVLSICIGRSISNPLCRLVTYAKEVAAGNLRQPDMHQKDEAGQLSDALGAMVGTLKNTIEETHAKADQAHRKEEEALVAQQHAETASADATNKQRELERAVVELKGVVQALGSASSDISTQVDQSAGGAATQAQRISNTASAMTQMTSTIMEVARKAGTAAELSGNTMEQAAEGATLMREAVDSINAVQERSLHLKTDMHVLTQQAANINQIMNVISDIADQTNLLALNAAIEAARAGDSGRGFAVVADEVRKLAEKTMASTADVGKAIQAIQDSAHKNMRQVDEAVGIIEATAKLSEQAGELLRTIQNMVTSTSDQVNAIAAAAEEQSAASEEINNSIAEVNIIAARTAEAMDATAKTVGDLTKQSQALHRLITNMEGVQQRK